MLPLPRAAVVDSKYLLYLLLSGAGFLLGVLVGCAAALGKNAFDGETMGIFSCISLALALLSGSVTIPLNFLWTEEKSMLSLILAYPLSAAPFRWGARSCCPISGWPAPRWPRFPFSCLRRPGCSRAGVWRIPA